MVTDIAGYSSLMQSDEAGTFVALGTMRGAAEKVVRQHRGRIANTAGDSILAEFPSAVDGVHCALALQDMPRDEATAANLKARIGIHLGDVLERNGDLFGTAVNIAARLQLLADPGGIVVSSAIRDATAGKLPASFVDLGVKTLKNIDEPVRVYALSAANRFVSTEIKAKAALPLPDKPSIAVLPFDDLSGEHDQGYFADGIVEEIITALSRFRSLFVIARNSSFAYKGRVVDLKQVGCELGVRYVPEGSVRKAGNRVRIAGQLIDASTGVHLWADRFDGELEDIFDLQDQVTARVVGAVAPKLEQAEIERTKRKPTENLDAYDYYLRGLAGVHQWTEQSLADALSNFYRAIELDPSFAAAYGMASRAYVLRRGGGWLADPKAEVAEAERLARLAAETGKDDAVALGTAGVALSFIVRDHDTAIALADRAVALNPNYAWGWLWCAWVRVWCGEPEAAVDCVARALRLSPTDPHSYSMYCVLAFAHFFSGHPTEAASWAEMAVREKPNVLITVSIAAASNALTGRLEEAARVMAQVRRLNPGLRLSNLKDLFPIRRTEDYAKWEEGLRLAGLPE
jgi:adenylate cyclase